MRSFKIIVVAVLGLTLLFAACANFALATGQSSGYVQYKVTVSNSGKSASPVAIVVSESVQATGQTGFINITFSLSSSLENLTYSRDVNSSALPEVFPYLSGLTNQSLSYEIREFSITADIANAGQVPVTFNGTTYEATRYLVSFSIVNSSSSLSISGDGNVISMPSGLIDTVQLSLNQTESVNVTLLSTDLSLNAPASRIDPLGASLLGIALAASVAIAAPTIFKKVRDNKRKSQSQNNEKTSQEGNAKQENEEEKKPSYWVD